MYIEPSTITTPDGVVRELDVYPVGIFREFIMSLDSKKYRLRLNDIWRDVRKREWHSVKTTFNGYLAELTPWPENMQRCGSGWTKRRAVKDLKRRIHRARMLYG